MENIQEKTRVSIISLEDYANQEAVDAAVRASVDAVGGIEAFVSEGDKVLLKPNLIGPSHPDLAVTTHPAIVRAVVRLVKSAGGICFIGDGPGVGDTANAAKVSGITAVAEEEGATLLEFKDTAVFENNENRILKSLELVAQLKDMNVLITLPKLKTHCQMAYTGALKNQYGLIPGTTKGKLHFRFQNRDRIADLMVDINRTAKPVLAIMDAVIGMEGPGPSGGTPRKIGAVISSKDLAAVDAVALEIIGLKTEDVPVSMAARRAKFGETYLENIEIVGTELNKIKISDYKLVKTPLNILKILPLPGFILQWVRAQVAPSPRINPKRCIKCGRCKRGCPVVPAAIQPLAEGGPHVDDSTCIRCYCCHEFCPVKAIELKKSLLARCINLDAITSFISRLMGIWAATFRSKG